MSAFQDEYRVHTRLGRLVLICIAARPTAALAGLDAITVNDKSLVAHCRMGG